MNVSLRRARGKISYNALQIYLIFYALLFLSVVARAEWPDGISRIIDSIWRLFFVSSRAAAVVAASRVAQQHERDENATASLRI